MDTSLPPSKKKRKLSWSEKERNKATVRNALAERNKRSVEALAKRDGWQQGKVKYTRKEYRDEYLHSEEWAKLRERAFRREKACFLCAKEGAMDVHHMDYRNIVDVDPSCLVVLCRECHSMVHEAIDIGLIPKKHNRRFVQSVSEQAIEDYKSYLKSKRPLSPAQIRSILLMDPGKRRRMFARLKMTFKMEDELPKLNLTVEQMRIVSSMTRPPEHVPHPVYMQYLEKHVSQRSQA